MSMNRRTDLEVMRRIKESHDNSKSDQERLVMCDRAFKDAIAPYVEQKANIYNCCTSISVVVTDDGNIKHEYGLNEAQKTNLRLIDELIENTHRQIFNT